MAAEPTSSKDAGQAELPAWRLELIARIAAIRRSLAESGLPPLTVEEIDREIELMRRGE